MDHGQSEFIEKQQGTALTIDKEIKAILPESGHHVTAQLSAGWDARERISGKLLKNEILYEP